MNILPKKKWHVRTKENMARVRRDEAKAAAEEEVRQQRAKLADDENRICRLKARSSDVIGPSPFDQMFSKTSTSVGLSSSYESKPEVIGIFNGTKHVNLFAELEDQERQNLTQTNKDYEKEKKKEHNDWESKMGIMKRFAEDTKEYSNEKYWWEKIPLVRQNITDGLIGNHAKNIVSSDPAAAAKSVATAQIAPIMKQRIIEHVADSFTNIVNKAKTVDDLLEKVGKEKLSKIKRKLRKRLNKTKKKERKKRQKKKDDKNCNEKKKKKHRHSSSLSSTSSLTGKDSSNNSSLQILESFSTLASTSVSSKSKKTKLEDNTKKEKLKKLREERLQRERVEKERIEALLKPKTVNPDIYSTKKAKLASNLESERSRKYNSQFNPDFAKR